MSKTKITIIGAIIFAFRLLRNILFYLVSVNFSTIIEIFKGFVEIKNRINKKTPANAGRLFNAIKLNGRAPFAGAAIGRPLFKFWQRKN